MLLHEKKLCGWHRRAFADIAFSGTLKIDAKKQPWFCFTTGWCKRTVGFSVCEKQGYYTG